MKESGTVIVTGLEGRGVEFGTHQCVHCGGHFPIRPGSGKIRGYCMNCGGFICGQKCLECVPHEKQIEAIETAGDEIVRRYGPG